LNVLFGQAGRGKKVNSFHNVKGKVEMVSSIFQKKGGEKAQGGKNSPSPFKTGRKEMFFFP